jgi:hypothetical protein
VPPRVVEEPTRAVKVTHKLLLLNPFPVKNRIPQEDVFPVTGKDVGECSGHLKPGDHFLWLGSRLRITTVKPRFGERTAASQIEPKEAHSTVQIGRPAGCAVDYAVLNEQASGRRPDRLYLSTVHNLPLIWGRAVSPSQSAV